MDVKDIQESVKISVIWSRTDSADNGMMILEEQQLDTSENSLSYSTSIFINSVNSTHAGTYTCSAQVSVNNLSYLVTSLPESGSDEITIGVCYDCNCMT